MRQILFTVIDAVNFHRRKADLAGLFIDGDTLVSSPSTPHVLVEPLKIELFYDIRKKSSFQQKELLSPSLKVYLTKKWTKNRIERKKEGLCVKRFFLTWRNDIRQRLETSWGVREVPKENLPAPMSPHRHVRHASHGDGVHPWSSPAQVSLDFSPSLHRENY